MTQDDIAPSVVPDAFVSLEGAYLDAYDAIAKPDQVIPVSRYLLNYWTGDLDPIGTWLLIELRQRCRTRAHRQDASVQDGNWWRGKQSFLASAIHAGRKTVIDKLNQENHHPIQHFILDQKGGRRFSQRAGRSVPLSYRYTVAMDDPLSFSHQVAVRSLLTVRSNELPDVLQELAELENGDLYGLLRQRSQELFHDRWLPTVGDVVRDIHGPYITQQEEIARLCSELNSNITRPDLKVLIPWYFRDEWLPRLKHRRALMVMILRAQCYYNIDTGADRNEIDINWAQLREQLGLERAQMHRLRDHPDLPKFFQVLEEAAGRKPARVRVGTRRIPLVSEDEETFRRLVTQQEPYAVDPETGQMDMLVSLDEKELSHFDTFGTGDKKEKPSHFDTFGKPELSHFFPKPSHFFPKLSHFYTQTSIALIALIAPVGDSSSIAPAEPEKTAAADFSRPSFSPREITTMEAGLPPEWTAAFRRVKNNRKRVSVLLDMARNLGLLAPDRQVDRRAWGRLVGRSGGGRAGALVLASILYHIATDTQTEIVERDLEIHGVTAEQADSPDVPVVVAQAGSVEVVDLSTETVAVQSPVQGQAGLDRQQAIVDALAEYGVDPAELFVQQVAVLPHVTVEFVRAWGEHYRRRKQQLPQSIRNLPGLLLRTLEKRRWPPEDEKTSVANDRERASRWEFDAG